MVVPQASPKAGAEIGNEGTPFRCLGLHTHWKAPAEAQTRFSEDTLQPKFYRMEIDAAQPDTTGRPKYDSQNPLNISSRASSVNQTGTKLGQSFADGRSPTNPKHNSIRLRGFEKSLRLRSTPPAAKTEESESLAETGSSL